MSSTYPPFGSAPTQLCQRCGRPLPPNEVYCSSCGLVNTPSQPNNAPTQSPSSISWGSTPSNTAQPGGQPWRQSPAQPSSNNALNSLSASQQAYGPPNQYPTGSNTLFGTPDQQPNSNNFFGAPAPQQPFYPQPSLSPSARSFQPDNMNSLQNGSFVQQPSMNGYQQPGFANPQAMSGYRSGDYAQQTDKRSNRPKIGMSLTIVIILLVVVGGSIGGYVGYVYLKHLLTTSTTQTSPTVAPTPVPQEKPLFSDPFQNNNAGWDLTSKPGEFSVSAKGPTMTFVVNGQTLKIVTDNTYSSGSIALFVSNLPHTTPGAQATFSNLVIYPLQS